MKDPAFLMYYKDFEISTASWPADAVGWYMRLLCHQADAGVLPADVGVLASLARVQGDMYGRWCEVWELFLRPKFGAYGTGVRNERLAQVIAARKASGARAVERGLVGALVKRARRDAAVDDAGARRLAVLLGGMAVGDMDDAGREVAYVEALARLAAKPAATVIYGENTPPAAHEYDSGQDVYDIGDVGLKNPATVRAWEGWLAMRYAKTNEALDLVRQEAQLRDFSRFCNANEVGDDDRLEFFAAVCVKATAGGFVNLNPQAVYNERRGAMRGGKGGAVAGKSYRADAVGRMGEVQV
jgi:hypothetical protein